MSNQKKGILDKLMLGAVLLVGVILILAPYWGRYFWPDKPPTPKPNPETAQVASTVGLLASPNGAAPFLTTATLLAGRGEVKPPVAEQEPEKPAPPPAAPEEKVPDEWKKVVTLGASGSHITALINPRGAGILQLLLNDFQAADPKTGEPVWLDAAHKVKKPLELIPEDRNREIASYLLYNYPDQKTDDFPFDTLGKRFWKRVSPEIVNDNEPVQEAVFETTVDGVRITKTYTLDPHTYDLGFEVKMELADPQAKERTFRYQLQGPHGLPIEGQFYTRIFRNTLIGQVDGKGNVERKMQDLREIVLKAGGDEVVGSDKSIRYAMVNNQFFASGIAIDPRGQDNKDFIGQASPLLVESAVKGRLVAVPDDKDKAGGQVELLVDNDPKKKQTFLWSPNALHYTSEETRDEDRQRVVSALVVGRDVIVVRRRLFNRLGKSQEVITDILDPEQTAALFHNDVTVEMSTPRDDHIIRLKPGAAVVHKYVLYNGPLKVLLLKDHLFGETPSVAPEQVDFYLDGLHLNTLTDYPSNRVSLWFNQIGLTTLIIWFTNVMHTVLWWLFCVLQYFMPTVLVYGLCVIMLTVMVRGIMHPLSRKQARTTMRMQALKPELDALKEKHKDDKQGLQMAQMELYRKHGINPLGSCWVMFLQMPIFLGLYYALQESIHFRLRPFLWIHNLTAPDMLIHWGNQVPFISQWEHYGAMYWLGPYFNVLPVFAVVLMILQQKYTMPPATDDQTAMQQKWMKYSMILFGVFFYTYPSGLCLYFIASSIWGFAERKLLPKRKPGEPLPVSSSRPSLMQRMLERLMDAQRQHTGTGNGTAVTATPPPAQGGGKKKRGRPTPVTAAPPQDGLVARVRAWWAEVLKQAAKK